MTKFVLKLRFPTAVRQFWAGLENPEAEVVAKNAKSFASCRETQALGVDMEKQKQAGR